MAAPKRPRVFVDATLGYIFVMWFRHWRSGKIVRRANGRPFCIPIRRK